MAQLNIRVEDDIMAMAESACSNMGLTVTEAVCIFLRSLAYENNGAICLMPAAVYPRQYIDELLNEVNEMKAETDSGEQPVYDSVDAMFEALETE